MCIGNSVRNSVWWSAHNLLPHNSVHDSVNISVRDSVYNSLSDSVFDETLISVFDETLILIIDDIWR